MADAAPSGDGTMASDPVSSPDRVPVAWRYALCVCLTLTTATAAEVTEAEFDVGRDRIDATVERLVRMDFADVARPAATVLARRNPVFMPLPSARRMTDAEAEAHRRVYESPAYTVARLVWDRRTADSGAAAVVRVLADVATDRTRTDADVRRIAIDALARDAMNSGTLTDGQRAPLYNVAVHDGDDLMLRRRAAHALMCAPPDAAGRHAEQYEIVLRHLPGIIRAHATLADRHAAFNDLTNIGNRWFLLPKDRVGEMIRVGFELIEETPADSARGAYFTARRLGYMLKRPDEFAPPQAEHRDPTGNLAQSFFLGTVDNARRWWDETGRKSYAHP